MSPTLSIVLLALAPVGPGQPITPAAPWAIAPDDDPRTWIEKVAGRPIDPRSIAPIRAGDMVFDGESVARETLTALGIPVLGLDHDPTPGVLYVAMQGVTLSPNCNSPQTANAARNCSLLVDKTVEFPPLGDPQLEAAEFQKLANYYADFDLVISSERPPDYLPYTMAVIGGSAQQAGHANGPCGVANVACDGAKRNHVSLTFPKSCSNDIAETAAQETAHNWGLEHTDVQSDLMYPILAGAAEFRDECMPISHKTGTGATMCGYVHKNYCPDGAGEQQNSYQELLGVFGPRTEDTTTPTLVSFQPQDGATFTTADTIEITAEFTDDSNFIGVHWTWLEGLPEDLQTDGYRRCTNEVCDANYPAWKPITTPWDFITLKGPPPGPYTFKVEAMDAYGNHVAQTIHFTVLGSPGSSTTTDSDSDSDSDSDVPTEGGGSSEFTGGADGSSSSSGSDSVGGSGSGGCRLASQGGPWLLLLGLGLRRRRRTARRGSGWGRGSSSRRQLGFRGAEDVARPGVGPAGGARIVE